MPKRREVEGTPTARILTIVGWLAVGFYVAQHARLGPNHIDGGLLLGYLHTIAGGGRPYFDFIDLYGLASWPLPALFYIVAGEKVWGLRLWLVIAKLAALVLCQLVVARHSDRKTAWAAVLLLALLLGLPWPLLQTTYAFIPALVLELGVLALLLRRTPTHACLWLAGVLTGVNLCTKLNSGAFLWAGLMFVCFYILRPVGAARVANSSRAFVLAVRVLQVSGLVAYAVVFHLFIREHYNWLYALYLTAPLLLLLSWVGLHLPSPDRFFGHLRASAIAAAVPLVTALALLGGYLGGSLWDYIRDMAAILARLEYVSPVPPIGEPGLYVGFNEFLWPQFPWLVSAVFGLWWWSRARRAASERSLVPAFFALYVFNLFVMYSRTDESHLHQAMLLGAPLLPLMWVEAGGPTGRRSIAFRSMALGFLVFACATLGTRPRSELFDRGRGDWQSPMLAWIRFARDPDPYVRRHRSGTSSRYWDETANRAAAYIDRHTPDGSEVLILARNELLNFASRTTPGGGRHRYLWYLLRNEHFDRAAMEAVGPPDLLSRWYRDPPAMIVRSFGGNPVEAAFPEIKVLVAERYSKVANFRHLAVYQRRTRSTESRQLAPRRRVPHARPLSIDR